MNQYLEPPLSPRRPWVAVAISFLFPGLGQVYAGKLAKGLFLSILNGLPLPILLIAIPFDSSPARTVTIILALVAQVLFALYTIIDAGLLAQRVSADYRLKEYNRWYVYLLLVLMGSGAGIEYSLQFRSKFFEAFQVPTASMFPTIIPGDRFMANKSVYNSSVPKHGDIIVFPNPEDKTITFVKRVVALAGDTVEIKNDRLIVNGRELALQKVSPASITEHGDTFQGTIYYETNGQAKYKVFFASHQGNVSSPSSNMAQITVPKYHCFVLGDNRNHALDSRNYGPIPLATIKARADYLYFPSGDWSRFGKIRNE
jgi:signal peptidase I